MKSLKLIIKAPLFVLSFLLLIVFKVIQPIIKFQLCVVGFHRYGHLALEPEIFLAEKDITNAIGGASGRLVSIWSFGPSSKQSNRYLASKWKDVLTVFPSWIVDSFHKVGLIFPFLRLAQASLSITGNMNGLDKTAPHLSFSSDELAEGKKCLEEMGVDSSQPYVCLIVRDGGHYKSKGSTESSGYDLLNFDINDFAAASELLIEHGYQVIRMGSGSERPFTNKPDGVIDYALSQNRSEFLDVFLAATCSFAISTQTGPDAVCMLFRRPVLYVDVTRYCQFFFGSKIATWSPVRLLRNGKLLNLSEIANSEIAWFKDPNLFSAHGITQQKSSREELRELVRSYIQGPGNGLDNYSSIKETVARGMGERGKDQFGEVTAELAPNAERILGEWVVK
jgi:putative glycosyltransferase (TIGR04372 family)